MGSLYLHVGKEGCSLCLHGTKGLHGTEESLYLMGRKGSRCLTRRERSLCLSGKLGSLCPLLVERGRHIGARYRESYMYWRGSEEQVKYGALNF